MRIIIGLVAVAVLTSACQQATAPIATRDMARGPAIPAGAIITRPLRFLTNVPTFVTFAPDSTELDLGARQRLNIQASYMLDNPQYLFRMFGHADTSGSEQLNTHLAERRAMAAREYLLSLGIPPQQLLSSISLGESEQLDLTDLGGQLNRRVVTELYNPV